MKERRRMQTGINKVVGASLWSEVGIPEQHSSLLLSLSRRLYLKPDTTISPLSGPIP